MNSFYVRSDLTTKTCRIHGKQGKLIIKANEYLEQLEIRGLSLQTVRAYSYDLSYLFNWLTIVGRSFKNFNQNDLMRFTKYQRKQNAKPRSINRRLTSCEVFYRFCYNTKIPCTREVIYPNPHYKSLPRDSSLGLFRFEKKSILKLRVKIDDERVKPLKFTEIRQFIESFSKYRDFAIIHLMLKCGLRASEVLSLTIENVDLKGNQIRIMGKGKKERLLPLTEDTSNLLNKYLHLERPIKCETRNVFVVLQGKKRSKSMTYSGLRNLFRHHRKSSGVPNANPHRFRHTFGTSMAVAGVQLPILQKMMGHADSDTTLQYIELNNRDVAAEYNKAMIKMDEQYEEK